MQIFRLFLLVFCLASSASLFAQANDSAGVIKDERIVAVADHSCI
jgi:hypothetical protein